MMLSLPLGVVATLVAYRELNSGHSDQTVSVKSKIDRSWELLIVVGSIVSTLGVLRDSATLWIGLIAIEVGIIGRFHRNWSKE